MPKADEQLAYWTGLGEPPGEFVYVIRAKDDSPIKVGRAVDVRKRIATLQTGNPRSLELICTFPGDSLLEWQLHRRLHGYRLVGEWFDGEIIPRFLDFTMGLAEWMIDNHPCEPNERGSVIPNFRGYGDGWTYKGMPAAERRFVEPDPEYVRKMAAQREREAEQRAFLDDQRRTF